MRLRRQFWIWSLLLLVILSIFGYQLFYTSSWILFGLVEGMILLTFVYLVVFYKRIIQPLHIIGNGMELLKEQDFSSRLGYVGQKEADRLVDIFNKMMDQLKNERLQVREQNHFLDLLINASPMGVIILNFDEEIISINPSGCQIFGIQSVEEVAGRRLEQLSFPLAEELARIPLSEASTVRLNDANIYKCTHSSFMDRGFNHPFYLIETLTEEVFKAERKAYEKVIRMISHEVNNTTAGITSTLDTLESTFSEMEEMEDVCEVLRVSIDRCYGMSHFITNFADVVRIPEPVFQSHDLAKLLTACKRFMEHICRDREIQLVMELQESLPEVRVDASLFEQVLVNIIKNAAESIGHGGTIYLRTEKEPLCLEIVDTGAGISKETEAKLFTPFFSTKPNGQGIGLIFIREVLQKQGCRFSLRTYPDGLTRFKIWFPDLPYLA